MPQNSPKKYKYKNISDDGYDDRRTGKRFLTTFSSQSKLTEFHEQTSQYKVRIPLKNTFNFA